MAGPLISFLTDFGGESAPATCRGVMWGIAPDARILDLNHGVRKYAVRDGAFLLSRAVPYLPVGVHLAVVDPGVGTTRRPIAVRADRGDLLVGPDNGLLQPAARALGGVVAAHELTNRDLFLPEVSATFHGRDVFAPVAAHLAAGTPLEDVGPPLSLDALVDLRLPEPRVTTGTIETAVLFVDSFGNARIAGGPDDLAEALGAPPEPGHPLRVRIAGMARRATWQSTFGEVEAGATIVYEDADYGGLGIAVNQGSAAEKLGLAIDVPVRLEDAGR